MYAGLEGATAILILPTYFDASGNPLDNNFHETPPLVDL